MGFVRRHGGTAIAAALVILLMALGFVVQDRITADAFDRLEADQVAQDAQRVRIGLESWAALLSNYGATNSIWDDSYEAVRTGNADDFVTAFPPRDLQTIYGLDGTLGVAPDGGFRGGGIGDGSDRFREPPEGLRSPADLARLFDPKAEAGVGRCGVVATATVPYLYCGFAAHRGDGGPDVSGGLIYLKSLGGARLDELGTQLSMPMRLVDTQQVVARPPDGAAAQPLDSSLGRLEVATSTLDSKRIALRVSVPTVGDERIVLEADRERVIHERAASVGHRSMLLSALIAAALFVAVLLVMRREVRRQVGPLRRAAETVIESGDRTVRIGGDGAGDIGRLGAAIDHMLDAMASQDQELTGAREAREAQLRATYVQQRLSARYVRRQAQTAIDETAQTVVRELQDVLEQARTVEAAVNSIDERVHATEAVADQIADQARAGDAATAAVTDSLARVSGIARLIAGVAEQTNLLALNATIEAARAGESGRGFAVVANEVKNLAAATKESTLEITNTLAGLEHDLAAMAEVIHGMTERVAGIGVETGELSEVAAVQRLGMQALDDAVQTAIRRIEALTKDADNVDRRAHERVLADGTIELVVAGKRVEGVLLDISEGGIRGRIDHPVGSATGSATGFVVDVVLELGEQRATLRGTLVRQIPTADGYEVGVQFAELSASGRELVRHYVSTLLASEV